MLNSHRLEFLYVVHLNMAFFILTFYHILNLFEILLINYKMLQHDHIIPNQLIMQYMAVTQIS